MRFLLPLIFSVTAQAMTLDQAVQSTLEKNESVGQSRDQLNQVKELTQQTKSAIYPSLFLNGSHLIQPKPKDPIASEFFPERQTTANFTLTQPLFRGFREFAAVRRQNDLLRAQEHTFTSQLIQLYQKVAESFMQVLALEQDLRNVQAQQEIYKGRIRDLQARTRRGESSSSETLTAQATAAGLDADSQILVAKLQSARENFAFLTGLPADTPLDEKEDLKTSIAPLEKYLDRIDERPDIQILKEQTAATDEEVSIAKGAHWPTADVVGNYYLLRPQGFMNEIKWDVQFRVSFPIFEGGLRQSQVREASSKKSSKELELAQLRRQAMAEIKSLHQSLSLRASQLKALKLSSDLAEKNYRVLLRDSHRGLSRSIDVQLGLTEYRSAKRTYDQARFEARLERIHLDLAAAIIPSILTKE